jgi:hypothetical protein
MTNKEEQGNSSSRFPSGMTKGWQAGLFVFAGAGHQFADGFFGFFAVVEDCVHLFGDGHLYAITGGQA